MASLENTLSYEDDILPEWHIHLLPGGGDGQYLPAYANLNTLASAEELFVYADSLMRVGRLSAYWQVGSIYDGITGEADITIGHQISLSSQEAGGSSQSLGEIKVDDSKYTPPSSVHVTAGAHMLSYIPVGFNVFDHWEVTGGATLNSTNQNPSTLIVTEPGTVKAIYARSTWKYGQRVTLTGSMAGAQTITLC